MGGEKLKCKHCGSEFEQTHGNQKYCSVECRTEELRESQRISNRESWRRTHNYEPPEKRTCAVCGKEFTPKRKDGVQACSDKCRSRLRTIKRYCNGLTGEAREAHKRESNRKNREKAVQAWKEKAEKERQNKPPKEYTWYTGTCKVCGNEFRTMNPAQVTCSKECGKRYSNARKQRRIPKAQMIDKDITLEALYRRDSGVCYLCGGRCDWNDRDKEKNTVGASYPSIDHIIPIARGGLHAWNNVRLAHFKCNQEKGADVIEHAEELIPANAYEFKREIKFGKKQTEQYTLDGRLLALYESTAEAEKITKLPQKGIQNCARGQCKSYRGYVWRYRV